MEYKLLPASVKIDDAGAGAFAGYASTFGNWDSVRERPVPGAFGKHLADFLRDGFIAIGHDWSSLPIATPKEAYEDDHGLFLRADFHSTPMAQDARTITSERIARGKTVKLSIGYEVLADEYTQDGRLLKDIKLYEVSLVTVPANQAATVTGVKSASVSDAPFTEDLDTVASMVSRFANRAKEREAFRAKEGRTLSEATRKKIGTLRDALASVQQELDDLLASTTPQKSAANAELLWQQYQSLIAQIEGTYTQ